MKNPFKRSFTSKELRFFNILSQVKLFEHLDHSDMSIFVPYLYPRKYDQNEVVFFRGDPSNALYILKKGAVTLNIDIKDKLEELTVIREGHVFGHNSLLEDTHRIYSAIVTSPEAELYVVPKVCIFEIFESHDDIRAKMMTSLAQMYNSQAEKLYNAYKSSFGFFDLGLVYNDPEY